MARQQPPTAKGFAFLAVEDPTGRVNFVIALVVYARDHAALQGAFVLIDGSLQQDQAASNLVARRFEAV